jgi:hypothetical protein
MVRSFLAELAEDEGVRVQFGAGGVVWGEAACRHIAPTRREITATRDIDALVQASAFCVVPDCLARLHACAVRAQLAAVGAAR